MHRHRLRVFDGDGHVIGMELGEGGLAHTMATIGADRIICASDYPHEIPPGEIVGELPEFIENPALPDEVKQKLLYTNAKRLYRIA